MESGRPDMKETRGTRWGGGGRGRHCMCELRHEEQAKGLPCLVMAGLSVTV